MVKRFVRPEFIVLFVLLAVIGGSALVAAFSGGMDPAVPTAPRATATFQFDGPDPSSVPVTRTCEEIVADALDVQAEALEIDVEAPGASTRVAALQRRLGALVREQTAAGCTN